MSEEARAETGAKVPLSASDGAAALQRGFFKILGPPVSERLDTICAAKGLSR
jgi:hypothetical protein